jgi:hypothetical protein
VLMDLETCVINAVTLVAARRALLPGNLVNQNAGAGNNWAKGHYTRAGQEFC